MGGGIFFFGGEDENNFFLYKKKIFENSFFSPIKSDFGLLVLQIRSMDSIVGVLLICFNLVNLSWCAKEKNTVAQDRH